MPALNVNIPKLEDIKEEQLNTLEKKYPGIPRDQLIQYDLYNIYSKDNQYYTSRGKRLSNFTLFPIAIVKNEDDGTSVYVYRITNNLDQKKRAVYLSAEEIVSLKSFKKNLINLGKYTWKGTEPDFNNLIEMLNEGMRDAHRITSLFWQEKEKFWAWGNGISTIKGEFIPCNDLGFVQYGAKTFFIEAAANHIAANPFSSSKIEKNLIYTENQTNQTPKNLFGQIVDIFGNNGKIAIAFYLVSLFSDHIFNLQNNLPILGVFGMRGTGKTTLIMSILNTLYSSKKIAPVKLNNATQSGVAKRLMLANNALIFLDEYNDKVNTDKMDFQSIIRDIYNRTARIREGNQEYKDLKINTMCMVAGEQSPTDAALVERMIFFRTTAKEMTAQQKEQYRNFSGYLENNTMTHITHELIKYRPAIEKHYKDVSHKVQDELEYKLRSVKPSSRILENYASLLAVFRIIEGQNLRLFPFDSKNLMAIIQETIINHSEELKNVGVVNEFWTIIQGIKEDDFFNRDTHYKLVSEIEIELEKTKTVPDNTPGISPDGKTYKKRFIEPKDILYFNIKSVYGKYKKMANRMKYRSLDEGNLKYYLKDSPAFIGTVRQKKNRG